ncbi:MAG: ABC transporter permease [Acidimicrobiales bacterium]|nr:ABC transporter permease [Acidimicrobiales bacterium]
MSSSEIVRLVAGREIRQRLPSRAFKVTTALLVLLVLGAGFLGRVANGSDRTVTYDLGVVGAAPATLEAALAQAALAFDATVDLQPADSLPTAEEALDAGRVDAVLVLSPTELVWKAEPEATLQGIVTSAVRTVDVLGAAQQAGLSPSEASQLLNPPPLDQRSLVPPDPDAAVKQVTGWATAFMLSLIISIYGGYLLVGVIEEKSSAVVEVLLAHVRSWQLLAGKVVGIGAVALVQVAAMVAAGAVALRVSGVSVPGSVLVSLPTVLVWFVLGFAFYATVFAVAGSLVSRQEDAQGVSAPISIAFVAAYLVLFQVAAEPSSTLAVVTSLIPPLTPLLMPARMASGEVPLWQPLLAIALMLVAMYGLLRLGGRIYSTMLLHTGAKVGWREALRLARTP